MTTQTRELIDSVIAPAMGLKQAICKSCRREVNRGEWVSNGGMCDACAHPVTKVEKCDTCKAELSSDEIKEGTGLCDKCFQREMHANEEEQRHPDEFAGGQYEQ